MVEIIKINAKNPEEEKIRVATKFIKEGKLVVFPTETCYGLAADATNKKSVEKVYEAKGGKIEKNPILIIVADLKMAERYCKLNEKERLIIKKLMPSPLTLLAKKKKDIPDILTKGSPYVGFRISSSKVASALAKETGVPITATSANIHREGSKYSIKEISEEFKRKVDLILDAGELPKVEPSTLVQIVDDEVKILREGPISREKIEDVLR